MSDQQIISLYMHVFPHYGIILDHIDYDLNRQLPLYVRYVLVYNMFQAPMLLEGPSWPWSYISQIENYAYAISVYYHWCEFESRSGRDVQRYVIKIVSDLRQVGGFLTNKIDAII
jgi:hypothetical protein